jgi:DNA-binding SARP family transcriptional activator
MPQAKMIQGSVAADAPAAAGELAGEVFELLPFGIAVFDAGGTLLAANDTARELLGDPALERKPRTCCELFGCRKHPPLEDGCITEFATAGSEPLPEIRVDREQSPYGALWVTAAPLGDDGTRAVFHLRPGDSQDRRRRTTPHWTAGPRLRIYTLGRTAVESAEGPIGGNWLQHRPGQLLKYLVCERQRMVHADEIAESFWPGSDPGVLNNVRHFVHALREKLEPDRPKRTPSSFVVAGRGGYIFSRERVWIDADEFEEKVAAGLAAYERGEDPIARRLLEDALQLYRGDFLADEPYAEWAYVERERLRDLAGRLLSTLSELALAQGDRDQALDHARRLADMYPFDTAVQRRVIALYLRQGRSSDAVRRYNELRVRMRREFGVGPEFELSELTADNGYGTSSPSAVPRIAPPTTSDG